MEVSYSCESYTLQCNRIARVAWNRSNQYLVLGGASNIAAGRDRSLALAAITFAPSSFGQSSTMRHIVAVIVLGSGLSILAQVRVIRGFPYGV